MSTETLAVTEAITEAVAAVAETAQVNNGFVVAMGIGTVFIGLICIILLIKLMSMVLSCPLYK